MQRTFCAMTAIAAFFFANIALAQDSQDTSNSKHKRDGSHDLLTISNKGITITSKDSATKAADSIKRENRMCDMSYALFDLGINKIEDNSNYADPAVKSYLNVPAGKQNKNLFDLRSAKSINVNIYPWMIKFKALKTRGQRIYVSSGIGLQIYNFRFQEPLTYTRNPAGVILDTISFRKNKLALNYLNIPLMLTFKTKLAKDTWLVYGGGITEGFLLNSWTKQVSSLRGKVKMHDQFGLADFNTCLSAEFGVEGVFRLYATYQLTSMYGNGFDQHPFCIGLRFGGI